MEDPRKTGLKRGLEQLTLEQLQRLRAWEGPLVLDNVNYKEGQFCPLAVALDLPRTLASPSDEAVVQHLTGLGLSVYNTRGIVGKFYTSDRRRDLFEALDEVIKNRVTNAA